MYLEQKEKATYFHEKKSAALYSYKTEEKKPTKARKRNGHYCHNISYQGHKTNKEIKLIQNQ